jgi:hypothetical protein
MERDWKIFTVEAFVPVVFILVIEYFMFFNATLHEVQNAKEKEIERIRKRLVKRIETVPDPRKRITLKAYVAAVHDRSKEGYESSLVIRKEYKKTMQRRMVYLILSVIVSIVLFVVLSGVKINYRILGTQTIVNTLCIGLFQLYFYHNVGLKYNYNA